MHERCSSLKKKEQLGARFPCTLILAHHLCNWSSTRKSLSVAFLLSGGFGWWMSPEFLSGLRGSPAVGFLGSGVLRMDLHICSYRASVLSLGSGALRGTSRILSTWLYGLLENERRPCVWLRRHCSPQTRLACLSAPGSCGQSHG